MPTTPQPLYVSDAALAIMTVSRPRMAEAKDPQIPFMTFERSSCGLFLFYYDERFLVIAVLPRAGFAGCVIVAFYQRALSNFAAVEGARCLIDGKEVHFTIAEQLFKGACVVAHMKEGDSTSDEALLLLKALETVMSATNPVDCKKAPSVIKPFDSAMWDKVSRGVMTSAQDWKCMDPRYYDLMQCVGTLAKDNGIPVNAVYFFEAADDKDMKWGCGLSVKGLYDWVVTNVEDSEWLTSFTARCAHPGTNYLGLSLNETFLKVVGTDGCFLGRSVEDYRESTGYTFPCFTYVGEKHKRGPSSADEEDEDVEDDEAVRTDAKCARTLSY